MGLYDSDTLHQLILPRRADVMYEVSAIIYIYKSALAAFVLQQPRSAIIYIY